MTDTEFTAWWERAQRRARCAEHGFKHVRQKELETGTTAQLMRELRREVAGC